MFSDSINEKLRNASVDNPVPVMISGDARKEYGPGGNLTGHKGVYIGDYDYPDDSKPMPYDLGNPLIITDIGEQIWGCECWWIPLEDVEGIPFEEIRRELERHKALLRSLSTPSAN